MRPAAETLGEVAGQDNRLGSQSLDAGLLELNRGRRAAHHTPVNVMLHTQGDARIGIIERTYFKEIVIGRRPR